MCTDDAILAERLRRLRNLGQRSKGEHVELGYNERLDGLQAALLRVKLRLPRRLERGAPRARRRLPRAARRRRPAARGAPREPVHLPPVRDPRRTTATRSPAGCARPGSRPASTTHAPCTSTLPGPGTSSRHAELPVAEAWAARRAVAADAPRPRARRDRARGRRDRRGPINGGAVSMSATVDAQPARRDSHRARHDRRRGRRARLLGTEPAPRPERQLRPPRCGGSAISIADRLERFGRRYPAARTTGNIERRARRPGGRGGRHRDAGQHPLRLAAQALTAGKHVFVEKPLAPSSELADELVAMAAERDRMLMCGHTFIYSPPVRAVKRMLDAGTLGEIYFISSSRVNLGLHQRDVSVDLGPRAARLLDPALLARARCRPASARSAATRSSRGSLTSRS